jgi:hypothetical protein
VAFEIAQRRQPDIGAGVLGVAQSRLESARERREAEHDR